MKNNENFTMSVVLKNKFGTLMRVTSLFSKRGYNINTLHVAPLVENNEYSRIILTSNGDQNIKEQILRQLEKLVDVREAKII
ncbi:MAG: acetolactate synthase small subunit [Ruminococcus sp.]|jgi:acetolactate synthase-1/3 small subunit|nr:acetolactate synthase small subunit [Ruminococcus sp.]